MLRSVNLLSLPSHPAVDSNALGVALSSLRLGDSAFSQTDGMVCMQGKQKKRYHFMTPLGIEAKF